MTMICGNDVVGPRDTRSNFASISLGVLGSLIWLGVSWYQWMLGRRYAWRMLAFTLLSGMALALELFDFPPKLDILDAHALWHFSTAPLPLLFYK